MENKVHHEAITSFWSKILIKKHNNLLSPNWSHPPFHASPQIIDQATQNRSVMAQRILLGTIDATPRFHCCKPIPPSPCKISASNQATSTTATGADAGGRPYHPTRDDEQPQKLRCTLAQADPLTFLRYTGRHIEYKGNTHRIVGVQGEESRIYYAHNLSEG